MSFVPIHAIYLLTSYHDRIMCSMLLSGIEEFSEFGSPRGFSPLLQSFTWVTMNLTNPFVVSETHASRLSVYRFLGTGCGTVRSPVCVQTPLRNFPRSHFFFFLNQGDNVSTVWSTSCLTFPFLRVTKYCYFRVTCCIPIIVWPHMVQCFADETSAGVHLLFRLKLGQCSAKFEGKHAAGLGHVAVEPSR